MARLRSSFLAGRLTLPEGPSHLVQQDWDGLQDVGDQVLDALTNRLSVRQESQGGHKAVLSARNSTNASTTLLACLPACRPPP